MKTSVYVPQPLMEQARAAGLSLSAVLQEALRTQIEAKTSRCSRCGGPLPKEPE